MLFDTPAPHDTYNILDKTIVPRLLILGVGSEEAPKYKIIKEITNINYLMINSYKDIIYIEYFFLNLYKIIHE